MEIRLRKACRILCLFRRKSSQRMRRKRIVSNFCSYAQDGTRRTRTHAHTRRKGGCNSIGNFQPEFGQVLRVCEWREQFRDPRITGSGKLSSSSKVFARDFSSGRANNRRQQSRELHFHSAISFAVGRNRVRSSLTVNFLWHNFVPSQYIVEKIFESGRGYFTCVYGKRGEKGGRGFDLDTLSMITQVYFIYLGVNI